MCKSCSEVAVTEVLVEGNIDVVIISVKLNDEDGDDEWIEYDPIYVDEHGSIDWPENINETFIGVIKIQAGSDTETNVTFTIDVIACGIPLCKYTSLRYFTSI